MGELGSAPLVSNKTGVADLARIPAQNSAGDFVGVTPTALAAFASTPTDGRLETSDTAIIKGGRLLVSYDTDDGTVTKQASPAEVALLIRNPDAAGQIIHQRFSMNYDGGGVESFIAQPFGDDTMGKAPSATRAATGRYRVQVPGWPAGFDAVGLGITLPFADLSLGGLSFAEVNAYDADEIRISITDPGTGDFREWNGVLDVYLYFPLPIEGALLTELGDTLTTEDGNALAL